MRWLFIAALLISLAADAQPYQRYRLRVNGGLKSWGNNDYDTANYLYLDPGSAELITQRKPYYKRTVGTAWSMPLRDSIKAKGVDLYDNEDQVIVEARLSTAVIMQDTIIDSFQKLFPSSRHDIRAFRSFQLYTTSKDSHTFYCVIRTSVEGSGSVFGTESLYLAVISHKGRSWIGERLMLLGRFGNLRIYNFRSHPFAVYQDNDYNIQIALVDNSGHNVDITLYDSHLDTLESSSFSLLQPLQKLGYLTGSTDTFTHFQYWNAHFSDDGNQLVYSANLNEKNNPLSEQFRTVNLLFQKRRRAWQYDGSQEMKHVNVMEYMGFSPSGRYLLFQGADSSETQYRFTNLSEGLIRVDLLEHKQLYPFFGAKLAQYALCGSAPTYFTAEFTPKRVLGKQYVIHTCYPRAGFHPNPNAAIGLIEDSDAPQLVYRQLYDTLLSYDYIRDHYNECIGYDCSMPRFPTSQLSPWQVYQVAYGGCAGSAGLLTFKTHLPFDSIIWELPDSSTQTGKEVTYSFDSAGTYIVVLRLLWPDGNWQEIERQVVVLPDAVAGVKLNAFSKDTVICEGEEVAIGLPLLPSNATYLWSDGSTASSRKLVEEGSLSVQLLSKYHCSDSAAFRISYSGTRLPVPDSFTSCNEEEVDLQSYLTTTSGFSWYDGVKAYNRSFTQSGTYHFSYIRENCRFTDSVIVDHYHRDSVAPKLVAICADDSLILQLPEWVVNPMWQDSIASYSFTLGADDTRVLLTFSNPCGGKEKLEIAVKEQVCVCPVYFPTVMRVQDFSSPDNATLQPHTACSIQSNQLMIFNRWGQEVYRSSTSSKAKWDGEVEGELAPEGSYIFTYTAVVVNDLGYRQQVEQRGQFYLIR